LVGRASTTAPLRVRPQMATSMRQRTATPTATPGAVGSKRAELRTLPRNPAHRAGDSKKKAAVHRPSAVEAEAGNPDRRVLVVRQAEAAVVAGVAAAGEPNGTAANEVACGERCW
jgi:hypothetical protein